MRGRVSNGFESRSPVGVSAVGKRTRRYGDRMRRVSVGVVTATIISGVLLVGGVIMFFAARPTGTAPFGWFAYQPLAGAAFFPGSLIMLTPLMVAAATIAIVGLVGIGAMAGYLLGRRHQAAP